MPPLDFLRIPPKSYLQLATIGIDGNPRVRIITSRGYIGDTLPDGSPNPEFSIDAAQKALLRFTTDLRTDKIGEIRKNPQVEALYWSDNMREQFRLRGQVYLLSENNEGTNDPLPPYPSKHSWKEEFDMYWNYFLKPEWRVYWTGPCPGLPKSASSQSPIAAEILLSESKGNFCIGILEINEVDWVKLSKDGNRRIKISRNKSMEWTQQELNP